MNEEELETKIKKLEEATKGLVGHLEYLQQQFARHCAETKVNWKEAEKND